MLSLGSRVGRATIGSRTDTDGRLATSDHSLFAAEVVALIVVDVVHVIHRSGALTIVVISELERLVLGVTVLDDVVRVIEQVDADDTKLAGGDILTDGSDHCRPPYIEEQNCSTKKYHTVCTLSIT